MASGQIRQPTQNEIGKLKTEFGKALSCYERALFLANAVPPDDKTLYVEPDDPFDMLANITEIYLYAAVILADRHVEVVRRYGAIRGGIEGETPIDREVDVVIKCGDHVWLKCSNLVDRASAKSANPSGDALNQLAWDWKGLNKLCHLFMREISHLCSRVDEFKKRLDASKALEKYEQLVKEAKRSLKWAIVGIIASAGLALLAVGIGVLQWMDGSTEKTEAAILTSIAKINSTQQLAFSYAPPYPVFSDINQMGNLQLRLDDSDGNIYALVKNTADNLGSSAAPKNISARTKDSHGNNR